MVFRCDALDQLMYLLSFMSNFMMDLLDLFIDEPTSFYISFVFFFFMILLSFM